MVAETKKPIQTVGRRKTGVARVILRPGSGSWSVNGRPLARVRASHFGTRQEVLGNIAASRQRAKPKVG